MKFFTIEELCKTNTGLKNEPSEDQIKRLEALVINVLDPLREHLGKPIRITSGFRSLYVNVAVGGAKSSDHTFGRAADFQGDFDLLEVAHWIKDNLVFHQLILEAWDDKTKKAGWIHVSYKDDAINNKQCLTMRRVKGKAKYSAGLPELPPKKEESK
jgi:hypothetical protein